MKLFQEFLVAVNDYIPTLVVSHKQIPALIVCCDERLNTF